jgi:pimeloyl-ACP methyl ester carboxylesterase
MFLRRGMAGLLLACAALAWPSGISAKSDGFRPRGGTHLYVLLGLGNNSPGLAEFGWEMQQQGIPTTVANYSDEPALVEDAIRRYSSGEIRSIEIIGHSLGGSTAGEMANALDEAGVPVQLVITLDPTGGAVSLPHTRTVNFFPRQGEDHFTIIAARERDMANYVLGGR